MPIKKKRNSVSENLKYAKKNQLRFSAVIDQIDEGVVIINKKGNIEYSNSTFKNKSGYNKEEVIGKNVEGIFEKALDAESLKAMRQSLNQGGVWKSRISREGNDGTKHELDTKAYPVRDSRGALNHYVIIEQEVTREVRLQKHFRQIQKMEALGTLAAGIAHDLNNIITPIIINTELALWDCSEENPQWHYLNEVLEAARRGKELVKQITAFSQKSTEKKKPIKVALIINKCLKFLRSGLTPMIEIRKDIKAKSAVINGNRTQIYQVLMNICSNAAHAMKKDGGVLKVSLLEEEIRPEEAERNPDLQVGSFLKVTVSDTGCGMDEETMDKAFDPFFTTKDKGEGSGMGLAIAHGIIKDHGGAINVYSESGKGSTFDIYLPRIRDVKKKTVKPKSISLPKGKERILIVDDESAVVKSLQQMLKRLGYKVVAKTSGKVAFETFRSKPDSYDLLITDQNIPDMMGLDLVKKILRIRPKIPVILITGISSVMNKNKLRKLGILECIKKPVNSLDLATATRRALDGSRKN